jgi:transposase-like protein
MNYTIARFNKDYPSDDVCLETIFRYRYGESVTCPHCGVIGSKYYKVKSRKCYECKECGHQIYPLAGTIFHKSDTPLTKWFFAIYLFSNSKNGVSAKELERHLGVTYKCAWRIAKQIRKLMEQDIHLSGTVEVDESYIGGKLINRAKKRRNDDPTKEVLFGMVERKGRAKVSHVISSGSRSLIPEIRRTIKPESLIYSDELRAYTVLPKMGYEHESITHSISEYTRGDIHTNTIEGFWSQLKRSINGTYHAVSPKYLQTYVNEFVFRYNYREIPCYPLLLELAAKQV